MIGDDAIVISSESEGEGEGGGGGGGGGGASAAQGDWAHPSSQQQVNSDEALARSLQQAEWGGGGAQGAWGMGGAPPTPPPLRPLPAIATSPTMPEYFSMPKEELEGVMEAYGLRKGGGKEAMATKLTEVWLHAHPSAATATLATRASEANAGACCGKCASTDLAGARACTACRRVFCSSFACALPVAVKAERDYMVKWTEAPSSGERPPPRWEDGEEGPTFCVWCGDTHCAECADKAPKWALDCVDSPGFLCIKCEKEWGNCGGPVEALHCDGCNTLQCIECQPWVIRCTGCRKTLCIECSGLSGVVPASNGEWDTEDGDPPERCRRCLDSQKQSKKRTRPLHVD